MAQKLLAPFKKFPQQLPLFKKSSDKWKDISLFNYNSIYGMMDDVTCQSLDDRLHLFAVGTKRGEIKIYGSEDIVYTLIGITLKPIKILKFLHGQGRLLSMNDENDIVMWEYNVTLSIWEVASTISLGNSLTMTIDVSNPFSWKSDDDNLLQLLIVGMSNFIIRPILIVGNRFHVFDTDVSISDNEILTVCQDLNKDYEFGEIMTINFNSVNNDQFLVSFTNGLVLSMKSNVSYPTSTIDDDHVKENENMKVEQIEETKEETGSSDKTEVEGQQSGDGPNNTVEEEKEVTENGNEESETEKQKINDELLKQEETKTEVKVEVKKVNESVQVPFAIIKKPIILNYFTNDKNINTICWSNNDIVVNFHESDEIVFYNNTDGTQKLVETHKITILKEETSYRMSHLTNFKRQNANLFVFVAKAEGRPNLLCLVKGNHVEAEFETPSNIIDYVIVKDPVTDENLDPDSRTLLILCESQLIAIDLVEEKYPELQCPYLVFPINNHITALTAITQVSSALFPNHKTTKEIFKSWTLNTPVLSMTNTCSNDEYLDIIATGHSDGTITICQVLPAGVILVLISIKNRDVFRNISSSPNLISEKSFLRKKVGHDLINNDDDTLLRINNIQLIHNRIEGGASDELFCIAGNSSGSVFVLKYTRNFEIENHLVEITSSIKNCHEKVDIIWNDADAPELLESSEIGARLGNLTHIIKLNPSLPITAMDFKPQWNLLAVGCTFGFVLVDLKENDTIFSYSTLVRGSKNGIVQYPLTVGQQIKKSMRQSFRKLKKLKPSAKHTYTVNEDKSKDKDKENKPECKADDVEQKPGTTETIPEKKEDEDKDKVEDTVEAPETNVAVPIIENEPPIEISRKDKPSGTIGSLLIEATNLVSSIKEPCLFAGTNMGSIYAFELKFGLDGPVTVTLLKELHLQHKAAVLFMGIVDSNHVPLICTTEISSYERKSGKVDEKTECKIDEMNDTSAVDPEKEIGPSGDTDEKETKIKSGTLPVPSKPFEEGVEKTEPARKSVDAGKNQSFSPSTTMRKSGTLPASFLQAIGKTPGNADAHELLVVSEEQVKLFSLPSLKAKYKYKVVDTGHHFSYTKSNNIQENEDKKLVNDDSNNVDGQSAKKQTRRISTVGLCNIPGSKPATQKWGVAIALTNGEIIALTLNNLKKYLSNIYSGNCPILTSVSNGEVNLVVSFVHQNSMQITDFSQNRTHYFEPVVKILIPESARPILKVEQKPDQHVITEAKVEDIIQEEEKVEEVMTNGQESKHMNGHIEESEIEEGKDQLGDETIIQNPPTTHHGDVTMDSIKEYITNMDGNITVKTFETSTEKHITVNDGCIVTTVHEKQMQDGEIIKDQTMKITSDSAGHNNAVTLNE